eukprot:gene2050-2742_t
MVFRWTKKVLNSCCEIVMIIIICVLAVGITIYIIRESSNEEDDTDNDSQDSTHTKQENRVHAVSTPSNAHVTDRSSLDLSVQLSIDEDFSRASTSRICEAFYSTKSLSTSNEGMLVSGCRLESCDASIGLDCSIVHLEYAFSDKNMRNLFVKTSLDNHIEEKFTIPRYNPHKWTRDDINKWTTKLIKNATKLRVRALLGWSTEYQDVMYHYTDYEDYNTHTIILTQRTSLHKDSVIDAASDLSVDILMTTNHLQHIQLENSPLSQKVRSLSTDHAIIRWELFHSDTRIHAGYISKKTNFARIAMKAASSGTYTLKLYSIYGYGFCIPVKNYAQAIVPSAASLLRLPLFGFYRVSFFGNFISGGSNFKKADFHNTSTAITFTIPYKPRYSKAECTRQSTTSQSIAVMDKTSSSSRIVGGTKVNASRLYPFMVSLQSAFDNSNNAVHAHICGGSLIAPDVVLTAAHCVYAKHSEQGIARTSCATGIHHVDIGRITLTKEEDNGCTEEIPITDAIIHPQFNPKTFSHDIAILKLSARSSYKPIHLYGLDDAQKVNVQKIMISSLGWGHTHYRGQNSNHLMIMNTYVYDKKECKKRYANVKLSNGNKVSIKNVHISDDNFCAYQKVDNTIVDSCQGDSGGGMFFEREQEYFLIGLVSFGFECAYEPSIVPGVYTNVTYFLDWIKQAQLNITA